MKTQIKPGKIAILCLHFIFACLFVRTNLQAQITQLQKQSQTRQNALPSAERFSITSLSHKNFEATKKTVDCDTCANRQKLTPTHNSNFSNDENFIATTPRLKIADLAIRKLQRGEKLSTY